MPRLAYWYQLRTGLADNFRSTTPACTYTNHLSTPALSHSFNIRLSIEYPHSAKASPAAARATPPRDPAIWVAAPVKWVGVGEPVFTPLVPLTAMLLTLTDGQGDVSAGGALRVIILSGAAEGHEVPQGAKTVESDWRFVSQYSDD